jgi:hypothetical protein
MERFGVLSSKGDIFEGFHNPMPRMRIEYWMDVPSDLSFGGYRLVLQNITESDIDVMRGNVSIRLQVVGRFYCLVGRSYSRYATSPC